MDASKFKPPAPSRPHDASQSETAGVRRSSTESSTHECSHPGAQAPASTTSGDYTSGVAIGDFVDANSDLTISSSFMEDGSMSWMGQMYPYCPEIFPDSIPSFPSTDSLDLTNVAQFDEGDANTDAESGPNVDCSCSDILRIFEMVEICLVRVPHESSRLLCLGADESLRCQKEAVETCRLRLRCSACSFSSHDAMLIISICEKILASTIRMKSTYGRSRNGIRQLQQQPRPQRRKRGFLEVQNELPASVGRDMSREQNLAARNNSKGKECASHRTNQSLDIGTSEWRIDDEDKAHVLNTLLQIRKEKLRDLVVELQEVVIKHRWLVHVGMIRDLADRLARDGNLSSP